MKFTHITFDELDNEKEIEVEFEYRVYGGEPDITWLETNPKVNSKQLNEIWDIAWIMADEDYREGLEEEYLRRREL